MKRPIASDRAGKVNGSATVVIGRDNPSFRNPANPFFGGPFPFGRETDEIALRICERYLAFGRGGAAQAASGTGKRR